MRKWAFINQVASSPPYGRAYEIYGDPPRCKRISEIPGRSHNGMYSQSKKLRPGAGHKKLTRAQRKFSRILD